MISRNARRALAVLALIAAPVLQTGCGWFEEQVPETASVFVTGDTGTQVELLISQKFVAAKTEVGGTVVEIIDGETITVTVPWSQEYNISGDNRFFLQVSNPGDGSPVVNVQVLLDGQKKYDEGGILESFPFRFLYMFNQSFGAVIEVL